MTEGKVWGKKNSWLAILLVILTLLFVACVVVFLIASGSLNRSNDRADGGESNGYEQVESAEDYEAVIEVTNAEGSASTSAGGGVER